MTFPLLHYTMMSITGQLFIGTIPTVTTVTTATTTTTMSKLDYARVNYSAKKKLIRNLWAVLKTNLIDPLVVPLLTFCRCLLFRWLDYWEIEKNDSNFFQRKRVHWPLILGWTMNSDFIDNDLTYLNEHFPIETKSSWSEILKCNHFKCIVKIWSIV